MAPEPALQKYRRCYAQLLRLYAKPFYRRYSEGMQQTFNDLLRERHTEGRDLFTLVLQLFIETFMAIIRENTRHIMVNHRNIALVALVTASLLCVPLVAMQFTDQIDWQLFDFLVAGALLFGTGMLFEFIVRKIARNYGKTYRAGIGVALLTILLILWVNLAVGIIGNEDNPVNLLFFGVIGIAVFGALFVQFRPMAMSRVLMVTAAAQLAGGVLALILDNAWVFVFNGVFVALWLSSALLFRRAASAP